MPLLLLLRSQLCVCVVCESRKHVCRCWCQITIDSFQRDIITCVLFMSWKWCRTVRLLILVNATSQSETVHFPQLDSNNFFLSFCFAMNIFSWLKPNHQLFFPYNSSIRSCISLEIKKTIKYLSNNVRLKCCVPSDHFFHINWSFINNKKWQPFEILLWCC